MNTENITLVLYGNWIFKLLFSISISLNIYYIFLIKFRYSDKPIREPNYEVTAETIYKASFFFFVTLVGGATIGTYLLRKITDQTVELVPQSILSFTKDTLLYFIAPVMLKLAPNVLDSISKLKGKNLLDSKDKKVTDNKLK